MRRIKLLSFIFLTLPWASCNKSGVEKLNDVVAKVGEDKITREMVEVRARALKDLPNIDPQVTSLAQIIQGDLAAEVLAAFGEPVTATMVKLYWFHKLENETKAMRDAAAPIKDEAFMLKALSRPDYAAVKLEDFFANHLQTVQQEGTAAESILHHLLKKPQEFDSLAVSKSYGVDRLWIGPNTLRSALSKTTGKVDSIRDFTDAPKHPPELFNAQEKAHAAKLFEKFIKLPKGKLYPQLIETPDAFQIFKVEDRRPDEILVSILTVPKTTLDEWFWSQARHIPVELNDHELGLRFLKTIPWGILLKIPHEEFPEISEANTVKN